MTWWDPSLASLAVTVSLVAILFPPTTGGLPASLSASTQLANGIDTATSSRHHLQALPMVLPSSFVNTTSHVQSVLLLTSTPETR